MIIEEGADPLNRMPWNNAPGGAEFILVASAYDVWLQPGGYLYEMFAGYLSILPEGMWDTFNQATSDGQRLRLTAGASGVIESLVGRPRGNIAGLYESTTMRSWFAIERASTFIHEFAHHVDFTFRRLWPGEDGSDRWLTDDVPFVSLWDTASPTIPGWLYGRTDIREWFAELFAVQLIPTYTGAGAGSANLFFALSGEDIDTAKAIRQAFTDRLPMPPFADGIYDA